MTSCDKGGSPPVWCRTSLAPARVHSVLQAARPLPHGRRALRREEARTGYQGIRSRKWREKLRSQCLGVSRPPGTRCRGGRAVFGGDAAPGGSEAEHPGTSRRLQQGHREGTLPGLWLNDFWFQRGVRSPQPPPAPRGARTKVGKKKKSWKRCQPVSPWAPSPSFLLPPPFMSQV